MKSHIILYVKDQKASTEFYSAALEIAPGLNVPGMTEFTLNDGCILGLMPEKGIKSLLGNKLPDPSQGNGIPRAELYLKVSRPEDYHQRAIKLGVLEVSPVDQRDWGDVAGYCMDRDGHVIAFAKPILKPSSNFKLPINDNYFISDIMPSDKAAYVEHLKERQIYDQTLAIPFPYTEVDADWWINNVAEITTKQGRSVNWAIRKSDGALLIGGIGFHDFTLKKSHKAELGYWLAKPYWSQGIMTHAVKKVTEFGFKEFDLVRITANVFDFNKGSAKVLEKAGYHLEGNLRKHYKKDDKIFDGTLYAKVQESE